jgi:hypothetical protein
MVDVKIKTKGIGFSVPIPYSILNLFVSIISSHLITRLVDKHTKKYMNEKDSTYAISPLDKKQLKQIIHELKQLKGTEIVYVKAKDGSEITIRL